MSFLLFYVFFVVSVIFVFRVCTNEWIR